MRVTFAVISIEQHCQDLCDICVIDNKDNICVIKATIVKEERDAEESTGSR